MSDVAKMMAELTDYSRKLAIASNEYSDACRAAANARSDYDVAWAKALLRSNGSAKDIRESEAVQAVETEMRDARIAEAMRDALKERIRALEAVLNATQTRSRFLEHEMKLGDRYQ